MVPRGEVTTWWTRTQLQRQAVYHLATAHVVKLSSPYNWKKVFKQAKKLHKEALRAGLTDDYLFSTTMEVYVGTKKAPKKAAPSLVGMKWDTFAQWGRRTRRTVWRWLQPVSGINPEVGIPAQS